MEEDFELTEAQQAKLLKETGLRIKTKKKLELYRHNEKAFREMRPIPGDDPIFRQPWTVFAMPTSQQQAILKRKKEAQEGQDNSPVSPPEPPEQK